MNSTTFFTPTSLGIDQNSASHKDKFTNTMSIKNQRTLRMTTRTFHGMDRNIKFID
ncbi:hypothetical protein [Amedibacterium intestinale]|jgi:hypothetical protein|uniref:Uncharacterized protein n=1 Tax=Amedibacterium intestinale TaxID=2583452 RepID=A0A6N4TJE1_9FIRM|nr:hypothetical protein [Amedibacterium intestinale]BBK22218.1 hypothetical protein Aargi30884_11210 [Amedibacterium intestinale]BBK22923.1 hypothetical protein Aargi30884_18260 [Amedibacterium intestinale]BBK23797.1 hypothetical protein Aargi30884_27000 [Amedibacterium intestinale]BBK61080.1 hypothetical protein A9CBEGH2_00200 [Amedibacterium intestinale]BBK62517.1 hypothetical protein A9CBEGH2_14570 [Amedibacterium intestinale]